MPKTTFLNLPEKKRNFIETVAIDEFAEFGFENATINSIVSAAGIAKGSFYQYFDDKKDLFLHIIFKAGEKKSAYVTPVIMNPDNQDIFSTLEEVYRSGLLFAKDHPKESIITFEAFKNKSNPIFEDLIRKSRPAGLAFYGSLLELGIGRGDIDPDIDKSFVSHMLIELQMSMLDYYMNENQDANFGSDIMPSVRLMINLIKNGISSKNKENPTND
jgi:AcrR family transcriptional regulator